MIQLMLQIIYFMLPGYFANMAPVIAARIFKNRFALPIDFNKKIKGKLILGSHKTWRGLISGIFAAIIIAYLQKILNLGYFNLIDYTQINIFLFGFLMGFGALFGDTVKSFFKRRINIKPGKPWVPFDQIDHAVGSLVFVYPLVNLRIDIISLALVLTFLLHLIIKFIGYYLKLDEAKF